MTNKPAPSVQQSSVVLMGLIFLSVAVLDANAAVKVYPAPAGEPLSQRYSVAVQGQNSPVYFAKAHAVAQVASISLQRKEVQQDGVVGFTQFDADGPTQITVTVPEAVQSAKVLPLSRSITAAVSGNKVTFTAPSPGPLTVEVNGDWMNSLHIFVNPVETNVPNPKDPNVIYFGPGVHTVAPLRVGSGKTVYIAGGAVLYGKLGPAGPGPQMYPNKAIFFLEGSNIVLRGRGVIDGSMIPDHQSNLVATHGSNIQVEGVVLRDSRSWHLPVWESQHIKIENVKILGQQINADGMDIVNSQDVEVSDGFVRAFDDLVVVKTRLPGGRETRDVTVKHMVLWNELAHALSIGAEIRNNIDNVKFTDCDIIHDKGREWLLRVFNADGGTASHVIFDNIRIEEARQMFSLWIGQDIWSKDPARGHINDVTFSNIHVVTPERSAHPIQFLGFDADHSIQGVTFSNVIVGGKPVTADAIQQNPFVGSVSIQNHDNSR